MCLRFYIFSYFINRLKIVYITLLYTCFWVEGIECGNFSVKCFRITNAFRYVLDWRSFFDFPVVLLLAQKGKPSNIVVNLYKSEILVIPSFVQNRFVKTNNLSSLCIGSSIHPIPVSYPTKKVLPPLLTGYFSIISVIIFYIIPTTTGTRTSTHNY